jgi:5'-nucleotidase
LPERTFLNVNVPFLPREEIKGIRITSQGRSIYHQRVERRLDPRGREYFWVYGDYPRGERDEGTDFAAVAEGFISITPLSLHFSCCTENEFFSRLGAMKELRVW